MSSSALTYDAAVTVRSIFTEAEKAFINISKTNPEKAIDLLKIHLSSGNIRFRREANLLYDKTYCDLYEKTNKEFSVEEIEQVVFYFSLNIDTTT